MRWWMVLVSVVWLGLSPASWAGMRVVATTPDLAALARAVGGDSASVVSLSLPTQDPHFVDPRPNLALELSKADALLLVGLELEIGWLPNLLTGARNPKIQPGAPGHVDCSQFPTLLNVPTGAVSRAMGDIHPGGNPHYTYDPRAAIPIVRGIGARFAQIDAANAAAYQANADRFVAELEAALGRWASEMSSFRGTPVITFHRSWPYLADWLGLQIVIEVEPKPGIPPTPAHVATVMRTAQEKSVKVLLQESYYPTTTTQLVATRAGARLAVLPGGTAFDSGQTYIAHIDELLKALRGT